MHSSIPSSLLNPAHSSCSPAVKICAAALWLCGKSYFSLTCLPYRRDTNGLYPCTEFAKVLRPNWIFLDCLICAFTMVKTINRIAEKTGSTGFCSLDMMLTENALFFLGNNLATSSLLLWFTVELDSITQIHRLQINDSWICLNKKQMTDEYFLLLLCLYCMWQFFQGFYLLSSYICLFIHNEMHLWHLTRSDPSQICIVVIWHICTWMEQPLGVLLIVPCGFYAVFFQFGSDIN